VNMMIQRTTAALSSYRKKFA